MNNPYTYNPGTDTFIPQGLSTTHIRPQATEHIGSPGVNRSDKSLMNDSEQGYAYLSYAVGGSVSSLSFEDHGTREQVHPSTSYSWGMRGKVRGFSRVSRRNLLRRLASINRTAFRTFKGRLISVTSPIPVNIREIH